MSHRRLRSLASMLVIVASFTTSSVSTPTLNPSLVQASPLTQDDGPPPQHTQQTRVIPNGPARFGGSGIDAPWTTDSLFVMDKVYGLDMYVERKHLPNGKLSFDIPITRYYSPLITPSTTDDGILHPDTAKQLIEKHLLPETATLMLRVYDVDNDSIDCPETDELYVNGRQVSDPATGTNAHLTSGESNWSSWTVDVPIDYFRFPVAPGHDGLPPIAAQNTITIDVDVPIPNCYPRWQLEIDWGSIQISSPIRPVVFAHGWTGSPSSFTDFWNWTNADGIPAAQAYDLLNGIEPLATTAISLTAAIKQTTIEYGVDQVNLLAHSKGGLVSRQMLRADVAAAAMVDNLVTFSSPHHGTVFATSLFDNNFRFIGRCNQATAADQAKCQAAAEEISVERMREDFNFKAGTCIQNGWFDQHYHGCELRYPKERISGIGYGALVGTIADVSEKTATLLWDDDIAPMPDTAVLDGRYKTNHNDILKKPEALRCALHLIDDDLYTAGDCQEPSRKPAVPPAASVPTPTPTSPPVSAPSSGSAFQDILNQVISLLPGSNRSASRSSQLLPVNIDGGTIARFTAVSNTEVALTLTAPDGQVITAANASSMNATYQGMRGVIGAPDAYTYQYEVTTPKIGVWQLSASNASNVAATVFLQSETNAPLRIDYRLPRSSYHPGELINVQVALGSANGFIMGAAFNGALKSAAGSQQLTFHDDGRAGDDVAGDGIATATVQAPAKRGTATISLHSIKDLIERSVNTSITIVEQTGQVVGIANDHGVDTNGNGLYDKLQIDATVAITQAGHFELIATLVNMNGTPIATSTYSSLVNGSPLSVGTHTVPLFFDARSIIRFGQNGPYLLTNIQLIDQNGSAITVENSPILYTTQPYSYTQLERELIMSIGGQLQTMDYNNDGRIDDLIINADMILAQPGECSWGGRLVDRNGVEIGWTRNAGTITGVQPMAFRFSGSRIGTQAADGPYTLRDVTVICRANKFSAQFEQVYTSQPFSYLQFADAVPAAIFEFNQHTVAEHAGVVPVTVTLNATMPVTVSVDYTSADGSALAGHDYTATSGKILFAPGERSHVVSVPILDDALFEGDETFMLQLSKPIGGIRLKSPTATVLIHDNESPPTVQFANDASGVSEGSSEITVSVQLSQAAERTITVRCTTNNGSAMAGSDYQARVNSLVTIPAGQTSASITIPIIDDQSVEGQEMFTLALTQPMNAVLGIPTTHNVAIDDNDVAPVVQINSSIYLPMIVDRSAER